MTSQSNGKLGIESHHQGTPSQMVWQRDVYRTPRELQTDHGPRKAHTGTAVQQEHQSAAKTQTVSKSCGAT